MRQRPEASDQGRTASTGTAGDPGFGVYVHWPFCAAKCPYCDFNSHVRHGGPDEAGFRAALVREIETTARWIGPRLTQSVFFGGGTPSLMSPETVAVVLGAIDRCWPIADGAEITLEANPSSVEAGRFEGYRAAGVNRVSLGVQALDDRDLEALGRLHDLAEARAALAIASRTFERFSFDLIYARPRQTLAAWRAELARAIDLAGGHLSLYQLTIEAGTPFHALHAAGKLLVPEPELADDLYQATQEMTAAHGLPAYEISNHARPGAESRHNLIYWRYGEYAGIGAGAHGRVVVDGARWATATERNPEGWRSRVEADGHGRTETAGLTLAEQADECLLMGLRLAEGVDLDRLAEIGGVTIREGAVDELGALGLVERLGGPGGRQRLRATPAGRFVLNELVVRLAAAFEDLR